MEAADNRRSARVPATARLSTPSWRPWFPSARVRRKMIRISVNIGWNYSRDRFAEPIACTVRDGCIGTATTWQQNPSSRSNGKAGKVAPWMEEAGRLLETDATYPMTVGKQEVMLSAYIK